MNTPNPNPSPELRQAAIQAVLHEAREKGADSPMDYGDAEQIADAVIAALSQTLPAPGEVGFPDIGPDPMKGDRADRIEQSVAVCREAYVKQQKGVPDQTALVWRWHLGALLECATRLKAILARDTTDAPATVAAANDEGVARGIELAAKWHDEAARLIREDASRARSAGMEVSDSCGCLDHYADLHEGHSAAIRLLSQGGGKA